jgi:hypothetical protein
MSMLAWMAAPVAAAGGWEDVEILEDDSTSCEFEPGIETRYEVDVATLPQFDQQKVTTVDQPDGTTLVFFSLRRSRVQMLKVEPTATGPSVLVESQLANLRIVVSPIGETVSLSGTITIFEWSPDGQLVDRNKQTLQGLDEEDNPIIVQTTGVCRP